MSLRRTLPITALPSASALLLVAGAAVAADPAGRGPVTLDADRLSGTADQFVEAQGAVQLRQDGVTIRADRLSYRPPTDRAHATGNVVIERDGAVYRGGELDLKVADFSGWFIAPEFDFPLLGTRGQAERIDFSSRTRLSATNVQYTGCPRNADGKPAWELQARSIAIDLDANEGVADGAVLRFQGLSILALPKLSFPITGERKSGWLPPSVNIDNRSGLDLSVPYYWDIAPNRDATIAPHAITRRGLGVDSEFRYLEPDLRGQASAAYLPYDRVAGRSRYSLAWAHAQQAGRTWLEADVARVSDDDWWKDFRNDLDSLTPRMLSSRGLAERPFDGGPFALTGYAIVQDWQLLQTVDAPITAPYSRRPQLGLRGSSGAGAFGPFDLSFETELNRFELPDNNGPDTRPNGWRWHAAGTVAWPLNRGALSVVPRISLNAAQYRTDSPMVDGRYDAQRVVPTLSVDAGLALERDTRTLFGRSLRQTLEPRLLFVRTPYRKQDTLPDFDAFGRDFNFTSIYTPNAFAGIDRISDAHQLTAGVQSRLIDADTGAQVLRMGVAQRFRFRDQLVVPASDGSVDGPPLERRVSDLLLLGDTTLLPGWALDASLQYSPDTSSVSRSNLGATWTPGPFQTLNARYRLTRGVSEQLELGWQWPLRRGAVGGSGCGGTLYGVGHVNYGLRDSRVTDSLLGLEYDAGCWIARVVAERLSTGVSEATTRLLFQLELVGLSRLGANPLQVLKDNIPGYRMLREAPGTEPSALPATSP